LMKTLDELKGLEATKIIVHGKIDSLASKFSGRIHMWVTDHGNLIQIASKKASKAEAVTTICEKSGISLQHVIAFGDDANDIELSKICGWSVAMGNAIQALKDISNEITDTNDNDGVAIILERL